MCIFYNGSTADEGWWIGSCPQHKHSPRHVNHSPNVTWCGYHGFVLDRVHLPDWSKKPLADTECHITHFSVYLENAMAKLIDANFELHQQLDKQAE